MSEPSSVQPSLLGRAAMDAKAPGAFRTISEVATDLNVQQHVLRFWESKFPQVKPLKRGGGRRYYRPEDVALLNSIKDMLYNQGFTIRGVQKLLREGGRSPIARMTGNDAPASAAPTGTLSAFSSPRGLSTEKRRQVESVLSELKAMRDLLRNGGL